MFHCVGVRDHKVNKHMEVKEIFLCTFWGKGFKKKANLESHTTLHTREKEYHCTQCDKKFMTCDRLKTSLLRRPQTQTLPDEAPPMGKIHPFSRIAVTFEPVMRFGCPSGFRISFKIVTWSIL